MLGLFLRRSLLGLPPHSGSRKQSSLDHCGGGDEDCSSKYNYIRGVMSKLSLEGGEVLVVPLDLGWPGDDDSCFGFVIGQILVKNETV